MYCSKIFVPVGYYDEFDALVNQQKQARCDLFFVGHACLWYKVDGQNPVKRGHVTPYQIGT